MISEFRVQAVLRVFVCLIVLAFTWNAALAEDVDVMKCVNTDSHAEQRECLNALAKNTEIKLKHQEENAIQRIANWDEGENYRTASLALFKKSIEAFRKYRETRCDFMHSLAAGGNGAGDMQLECVVELTKQRIVQIELDTTGLTTAR